MGTFATKSIFGEQELIQAMPLDTSKCQKKFIDATASSISFNLSSGTTLVEIVVLPVIESADAIYMRLSDLPLESDDNDMPVCRCYGMTRLTYAIGTDTRTLNFFMVPPGIEAAAYIYVMEA